MNTKPFVTPSSIPRQLLAPGDRNKIRFEVDPFDKTGLYGQFPEVNAGLVSWTEEVRALMKAVQVVLFDLIRDLEFREFFKNSQPLNMGWSVNQIIAQVENRPQGWHIWSMNLGDNHNLALIYTVDGDLIVTTHQYQYRTEHINEVHWMLRHDTGPGRVGGLDIDSLRLHQALKVLSDPDKARIYLRAKIHGAEMNPA